MKKNTNELFETIKKTKIEHYISDNKEELLNISLPEYLIELLIKTNLEKSEVIKKSNIQENYGYQIFSGVKKPSRDKLIALCFGFSLSPEEAQKLLKYAGFAILYPRNMRDSIIISALSNKLSIIDCNIKLDSYNLSPL